MRSAVAHAIKTNHFPDYTRILSICWRRACNGLMGVHFSDASLREQAIMRGWAVNHEGLFSFTSTHDLCDASYTRKGLETMVRSWYQLEKEQYLEDLAEYERNHPEVTVL